MNGNELGNWKGNILELVEGWEENETHDPDVPAVSHSRGLTSFVFVPFEEVYIHCTDVCVMLFICHRIGQLRLMT